MVVKDIGKSFVQEFVLGFGFLSGLWIYEGVNPESEIIKAISSIVQTLNPDQALSFLFWLIPIIGLIISIAGSYFIGGWLGVIAVFLAFIGGIFISSTFGIILLTIGIILGFFAPYST